MKQKEKKDYLIENPDGSVTVKLTTPIRDTLAKGDQELKEVTIKPIKAKHMFGMSDKPGIEDIFNVLSANTGIQLNDLSECSFKDIERLSSGFEYFL